MIELLTYWISLNRTEKNSRDVIEKLVIQNEQYILDEAGKWNSVSSDKSNKVENKEENKEKTESN